MGPKYCGTILMFLLQSNETLLKSTKSFTDSIVARMVFNTSF